MVTIITGLAGALGMAVLWLYHTVTANKLKKTNEALTTLTKLQKIQNQGLKEAKQYAAETLKRKNEELSKDPASALDDFFGGVRKD
jgi:hypothetical protein